MRLDKLSQMIMPTELERYLFIRTSGKEHLFTHLIHPSCRKGTQVKKEFTLSQLAWLPACLNNRG